MISIPSGVFAKYRETVDYMVTTPCFGTECKLVYASRIVVSQQESFGQRLTMRPTGGDRGTEYTDYQEYTEDIILRVYWDQSSFHRIGNFIIPEGGCMTICGFDKYAKIDTASYLLLNNTWKFEKISEPRPYGLDNDSLVCGWRRV